MNRSVELGWSDRLGHKSLTPTPRRHGCWIHCYPDSNQDARRFIVRETFENGTLALSSIMTRAESDTERVLVAAGASPGEAHARVQEAIVRGTAFLFLQ